MIEAYIKNSEFVRAIRLDPTDESINECVGFVAPGAVTKVTVDFNTGIEIVANVENCLVMDVDYGDYIVKNSKDEFTVLSGEIFEARYTKVTTEDLVTQSQERMKKWYEEQKA